MRYKEAQRLSIKELLASLEDFSLSDEETDIFSEQDPFILELKRRISKLDDTDRTILLLYAQTGSLQYVGNLLNVSHPTLGRKIKSIRKKLFLNEL